jgi:hypothetical protein
LNGADATIKTNQGDIPMTGNWVKAAKFVWVLESPTSPPHQIKMDSWEDADGVVLSFRLLVWGVMHSTPLIWGSSPAGDFDTLEEAMAAGEAA